MLFIKVFLFFNIFKEQKADDFSSAFINYSKIKTYALTFMQPSTIPEKPSIVRLAPPTKAPSISD